MRDPFRTGLGSKLNDIAGNVEQTGREIYYAMSYLPLKHPARANLNLALDLLGVSGPEQIGLSRSVLTPRTTVDIEDE